MLCFHREPFYVFSCHRPTKNVTCHVMWRILTEQSRAPDSVRVPDVALVPLIKILYHNCFVLRMGHLAVS